MKLISFDGLDLTDYNLEDDTTGALAFYDAVQRLPGMAGAFDHYGDEQYRQTLTITRRAELVATSYAGIATALDALRAKANAGRGWLAAQKRDGTNIGTWAKLTGIQTAVGIGGLIGHLPVDLAFQATWPWWEDASDIWYLDAGEVLDDGLSFDRNYSTRSGAGSLTINNQGDDAIRRGLIVVKGASTNPTITNSANGWSIAYAGTVASGSTLYIDIGKQTAVIDGVSVWSSITLGSRQTGFFKLEIGSNSIAFTGGGTLEIHWAEVY